MVAGNDLGDVDGECVSLIRVGDNRTVLCALLISIPTHAILIGGDESSTPIRTRDPVLRIPPKCGVNEVPHRCGAFDVYAD